MPVAFLSILFQLPAGERSWYEGPEGLSNQLTQHRAIAGVLCICQQVTRGRFIILIPMRRQVEGSCLDRDRTNFLIEGFLLHSARQVPRLHTPSVNVTLLGRKLAGAKFLTSFAAGAGPPRVPACLSCFAATYGGDAPRARPRLPRRLELLVCAERLPVSSAKLR
jgi:hypothetical protein